MEQQSLGRRLNAYQSFDLCSFEIVKYWDEFTSSQDGSNTYKDFLSGQVHIDYPQGLIHGYNDDLVILWLELKQSIAMTYLGRLLVWTDI